MSTQTLVSTVIPVRNGKEYIFEAIDSVLTQSHRAIELIVVDDGSTDYDYSLLAGRDDRIHVIHLSGVGVSAARNAGMAVARGQYIAFLDADDIWFPGKIEAQVRYFEQHPEVGCVFGGFQKWFPTDSGEFPEARTLVHDCRRVSASEKERSGWLYTRLLTGLLVGMNTAVVRREVYDALGGFDESMRIGEDYLFWLKVSRLYEMHALDDTVALYRIHGQSAMNRLDEENHQAQLLSIARRRWGLANPDGTRLEEREFTSRLAISEFTHGYNHFWYGQPDVAAESFRKAFLGGALRFRSAAYFVLSQMKRMIAFGSTENASKL